MKHCKASQALLESQTPAYENIQYNIETGVLLRVGSGDSDVIRLDFVGKKFIAQSSAQFLRAIKHPAQPKMESSSQLEPFMESVYTAAAKCGMLLEQEPVLLYYDTFPHTMLLMFSTKATTRGNRDDLVFFAIFDMTQGY